MLKLLDRLIAELPDDNTRTLARALRVRIQLPMAEVLEKVPGASIAAKARAVGVTRTAYYGWLSGAARPQTGQAQILEKLTGFPAREIAGRSPDD
jgi:hypothetical protein